MKSSTAPITARVFHSSDTSPHPWSPSWSVSTFTKIQLRTSGIDDKGPNGCDFHYSSTLGVGGRRPSIGDNSHGTTISIACQPEKRSWKCVITYTTLASALGIQRATLQTAIIHPPGKPLSDRCAADQDGNHDQSTDHCLPHAISSLPIFTHRNQKVIMPAPAAVAIHSTRREFHRNSLTNGIGLGEDAGR